VIGRIRVLKFITPNARSMFEYSGRRPLGFLFQVPKFAQVVQARLYEKQGKTS